MEVVSIRQLEASIAVRKAADTRETNRRTTWAVKTLSRYSALSAQVDRSGAKRLEEDLKKIGYDEIERALAEDLMEGPIVAENGKGSYERFMLMMGNAGGIM